MGRTVEIKTGITNGELFLMLYPNADVTVWESDCKVRVSYAVGKSTWFSLDWWNAIYEE